MKCAYATWTMSLKIRIVETIEDGYYYEFITVICVRDILQNTKERDSPRKHNT